MYNIGYRHISIDISIYRHRICLGPHLSPATCHPKFLRRKPQLRQPVKAFRLQAALLGIVHLISYPVPVDGGIRMVVLWWSYDVDLAQSCWFSGFHRDFASILGGFPACPPVCAATLPVPLPLPRGWTESPDGRHGGFAGWEKVGRESPIRESGRHPWDTQKLMALGIS